MNPYIAQWHEVIRNGSIDNTYKMAWARSLVELAMEYSQDDPEVEQVIKFGEIADRFLRSFWDQTIYFNLNQSPNLRNPPEVLQYTRGLIAEYKEAVNALPVKYIRVDFEKIGLKERRKDALWNIEKTLQKDVCSRFMKVNRREYPLYRLAEREVRFKGGHLRLVAEYSEFLFDAINYRWAQILEKFNHSPRISQKVRGIAGDNRPKRGNIRQFREYLDLDPVTRDTCFQCGKSIPKNKPHGAQSPAVDHVIPWSFMYSDDLWNLAYCHSGCNSSKSNRVPDSGAVGRLEARNKRLLGNLPQGSKVYSEMTMAIDNNYLRKFWVSFKG